MRARTLVAVSPHLDDVALSAVAEVLAWPGRRIIATVFSGDPPDDLSGLAAEFQDQCGLGSIAMVERRREDTVACAMLGCDPLHVGLPEALYRRSVMGEPVVTQEHELYEHDVLRQEEGLLDVVAAALAPIVASSADLAVLTPLGTGRHRDHVVVRAAVEQICTPFAYYDDQPYGWWARPAAPTPPGRYRRSELRLSLGDAAVKERALACYRSQMTMLWGPDWEDQTRDESGWRAEARAEVLWAAP